MKLFNWFLLLVGALIVLSGLYLWGKDGFVIPWRNMLSFLSGMTDLGAPGRVPRESGTPIESYLLLLPLGVGVIVYALTEIGHNRDDDDGGTDS